MWRKKTRQGHEPKHRALRRGASYMISLGSLETVVFLQGILDAPHDTT
jgi:hypothetical protein